MESQQPAHNSALELVDATAKKVVPPMAQTKPEPVTEQRVEAVETSNQASDPVAQANILISDPTAIAAEKSSAKQTLSALSKPAIVKARRDWQVLGLTIITAISVTVTAVLTYMYLTKAA